MRFRIALVLGITCLFLFSDCFPDIPILPPNPPLNVAVLAIHPPMGFNTWNTFQTRIDEQLIIQTADAMIKNGMRDAGYIYINLDDGWSEKERDANGDLVPDHIRFPHGMKYLANYLHSHGFKFGIYNCAGTQTCAGYPGGRDHENQDAQTYASWGVDYLKYDWCYSQGLDAPTTYRRMAMALRNTRRPIVFSVCEWGEHQPWLWAPQFAQLWRTTGDINASYNGSTQWTKGWKVRLDENVGLEKYAGPGHWNDPDMLEVGNGSLTLAESRAHFTFWCMLAAPLIAGNDIRSMSPEIRDILINRDLVAIDQDPLGREGFRVSATPTQEIWARPLMNHDWAICLFNPQSTTATLRLKWSDLYFLIRKPYSIQNVWKKQNLGTTASDFTAPCDSHDVVLLRLHPAYINENPKTESKAH
ncbi:MAG TPA: glycoside hydrolase family 27 protein [Tepidisphaeraceae bacterium]|jgi:alpha-galactosidase